MKVLSLVATENPDTIGPLFLIGGLIYAISTSPEKGGTSLAALVGFIVGLFFGAALGNGHTGALLAELFSVLFSVFHSRKAKNRAKEKLKSMGVAS